VAVVADGAPAFVHVSGVRDARRQDPVTPHTLFRLESVTKTFTALAALALIERRRLALDAPITDVVPTFAVADEREPREVTLRRLLTHTAGLSRNAITRLRDVDPNRPYEDLFARNRMNVTLGAPDRFVYSNTGYLLVGAAIERAAGLPIASALTSIVTGPLGMATATADGAEAAKRDHATGHGTDDGGSPAEFAPEWLDPYVQRPVGGMHASITELSLFTARLMAGAREVLAPATFAEMTATRVPTDEPGVTYGFGVYVGPTPHGTMWTHTGAGRGTCAFYACVPERRFAVALVANAAGYRGWPRVRSAALEAFLGPRA
jgi:CubicO group peptidase (beta-lactamase class C family)